jgi:hypothetical protein
VVVTLADALKIALAAYDEDEAERERILELLAPVLLGDRFTLETAIGFARGDRARRIIEAVTEYQQERARIDAEQAEVEAHEERTTS